MSANIADVNHVVKEVGNSASNVRQASEKLAMQGESLRQEVSVFLDSIREDNSLDGDD
jgi:methyl-accepting chemotaxis protein